MMISKLLTKKILAPAVLAVSLLAPATYAQHPVTLPAATQAAGQSGGDKQKPPAAELFIRTELFFGTDTPDGEVGKDEFRRFLKEEVTRRFPDGLTVLTGTGQFRDAESEKIIRERSILLILLYPLSTLKESNEKIEQIRGAYKKHFQQQSVLRVDDPRPVLVSF